MTSEPRPPSDEAPTLGEGSLPGASSGTGTGTGTGTNAPRYRIVGEIGAGGMGVVHRAYDDELRREVALKVLGRRADDPAAAARFAEEARATARLQHPNIVPVYDFGTMDGRPFFAMKLVEGRTLAQVVEAGSVSLFRRLEIFVDVARAVAYAHERGIVHRDLKPQNVMIGSFGEVQVMDWGLAAGGGGTPAYMPPEQAENDPALVGPRSDVYGLGATLFHILTGAPPYAGGSPHEIVTRVIEAEEPPRARAADPVVPRELDAIAAKAMASRPDDRYASALALADDVQAFLEGRSVSALPEGLARRAVKWARRHRTLVGAGAIVALVAALGAAGTLTARSAAARREREARIEWTILRAKKVARGFEQVRAKRPDSQLGAEVIRSWQDTAITDGMEALNAWRDVLGLAPGNTSAHRFMEDGARALEEIAIEAEQWSVAHIAAATRDAVAGMDPLAALARIDAARNRILREHRAAVEAILAEAASGTMTARPDGETDALFALVRYPEAQTVKLVAAALDGVSADLETAREAALREVHPTPTALVERAVRSLPPAMRTRRMNLAMVLGTIQRDRVGETRLALARLCCQALGRIGIREGAVPALGRYFAADSDDARAVEAALALNRLGGPEAEKILGDADRRFGYSSTLRRRIAAAQGAAEREGPPPPGDPRTADEWHRLARALSARGDHDGAIAAATRGIEVAVTGTAAPLNRTRALARQRKGDLEGAIADGERATALDPENAPVRMNLAVARVEAGDRAGAMTDYGRAIEIEPRYARADANRGHLRRLMGDIEGALADLDRAIELDPSQGHPYYLRGVLRIHTDQPAEALADLERALALAPRYAPAFAARGEARMNLGDLDGAFADLGRALELNPRDATTWAARGSARRRRGDHAGALADLGRAIELKPAEAQIWRERAAAKRDSGDLDGALADATRAIELAPKDPRSWTSRGTIRLSRDEPAAARADLDRAIELDPRAPAPLIERARARNRQGDVAGAIADTTRAIELDPTSTVAWSNRAHFRENAGDHEGAIKDFERYLELLPHAPDAAEIRRRIEKIRVRTAP